MKIFLKFLLRNICEKKLRTILILFSITLSTALFFTTLTISGTTKQFMVDEIKKYVGSAEIVIYRNPQSLDDAFFDYVDPKNDNIEYAVQTIEGHTLYPEADDKQVFLTGLSLEAFRKQFASVFLPIPPSLFKLSGNYRYGRSRSFGTKHR